MSYLCIWRKVWELRACNGLCDESYTGVFAAITLAVHVKYIRDQWVTGSNCLRALMMLGCLAQLASVCAFAVYLALAISEHQGK